MLTAKLLDGRNLRQLDSDFLLGVQLLAFVHLSGPLPRLPCRHILFYGYIFLFGSVFGGRSGRSFSGLLCLRFASALLWLRGGCGISLGGFLVGRFGSRFVCFLVSRLNSRFRGLLCLRERLYSPWRAWFALAWSLFLLGSSLCAYDGLCIEDEQCKIFVRFCILNGLGSDSQFLGEGLELFQGHFLKLKNIMHRYSKKEKYECSDRNGDKDI